MVISKEQIIRDELYVIRHKPTGHFLPNPSLKSRGGRGGSYVEPVSADIAPPRIFGSMRAAKSALGQWLRGRVVVKRSWGDEEICLVVPVSHRKREEMEIVPVLLIIKEQQ